MKNALVFAALLAAFVAVPAFAEEGRVAQSSLAAMGLGDMQVMSDAQGAQIRGQGFAFAASVSASALPGSFTFDPAVALGFHSAAAASGAQSTATISGTLITFPPLGIASLTLSATVGSSGYATAASN
jgi:hypothetical protein